MQHQVLHFCDLHQLLPDDDSPLVVGVSGGVDSLVLLHLLQSISRERRFQLHVATLDHQLRGTVGGADAAFVKDLATQWGLMVSVGKADIPAILSEYALNIEEAARLARYTFFMYVAAAIGAERIAVGHQQDDQAETVLMHLIRGSGLHGLRGMRPLTPLGDEYILESPEKFIQGLPDLEDTPDPLDFELIRPLLNSSRAAIHDYAEAHTLFPREDETNTDSKRLRNRIRHEIIPMLETMNPQLKGALGRLATVVQADVEVIESRLDSIAAWMFDWQETQSLDGEINDVVYIDRQAFRGQPIGVQRGLIRKAVYELSTSMREFSFEQIEQARTLILSGDTSAVHLFPDDLVLVIGYDEVHIGYGENPRYPQYLPRLVTGQYVALDPEGQGYIAGGLRLQTYWVVARHSMEVRRNDPLECTLAIPEGAKLALRTWIHGDRFQPLGMQGKSQKLSDVFTNIKVPNYLREQVPLLTVNDEIAWFVAPTVSGPVGRIAHGFAVHEDSTAILRLRWHIEDGETNEQGP